MKITIFSPKMSFPLREGIQKQAWETAKHFKQKGHEVQVIMVGKKQTQTIQGIKVIQTSWLATLNINTDILHYFMHPTPLILPSLFCKAKKRIISAYDGALSEYWKKWWSKPLLYLMKNKITTVIVQTEYQKKLIPLPTIILPPIIPDFKPLQKQNKRTILFMSSPHPKKGIIQALEAFKKVKNAKLTIANSKPEAQNYVERITQGIPNITLKTIINPEQELHKANVYFYPYQEIADTFSVPISLIEAIQTKTPFVAPKFPTTQEYFEEEFLTNPQDTNKMAEKLQKLLDKPKIPVLLKKINNKTTFKTIEELYKC